MNVFASSALWSLRYGALRADQQAQVTANALLAVQNRTASIVQAYGLVTAVGSGACEITATCAGGYEDRCRVAVK